MPWGETCPVCGKRLGKSAARLFWQTDHTPVRDWISWNAAGRILIPAFALVLLLILLFEILQGGAEGLQRLLRGGMLVSLAVFAFACALGVWIVLLLQGGDICECVIDSRGVHLRKFLNDPTPLRLLLRLRSPGSIASGERDGSGALLLSEISLRWADIARVQLWPEKSLILIYAPYWWMRLPLYCTPFTWEDALLYMRDKVGRKKNLLLPPELVAPPKSKAPRAKSQKQQQIEFDFADITEHPGGSANPTGFAGSGDSVQEPSETAADQ